MGFKWIGDPDLNKNPFILSEKAWYWMKKGNFTPIYPGSASVIYLVDPDPAIWKIEDPAQKTG